MRSRCNTKVVAGDVDGAAPRESSCAANLYVDDEQFEPRCGRVVRYPNKERTRSA
jgi:hypothetical protein